MENQIDKIKNLDWQLGPPSEPGEWLLEIKMLSDIRVTYVSVQCCEGDSNGYRKWHPGFIYDANDEEIPYANLIIFGPGIGTDLYRVEYENRFGSFKIMRSAYLGPRQLITIDEAKEMWRKCEIINTFTDYIDKGKRFYYDDYWRNFISSLRKNHKEETNISIIDIAELNKFLKEYFLLNDDNNIISVADFSDPLIIELHNISDFKRNNDSLKEMLQEIFQFSYLRSNIKFRPGVYVFADIKKHENNT